MRDILYFRLVLLQDHIQQLKRWLTVEIRKIQLIHKKSNSESKDLKMQIV